MTKFRKHLLLFCTEICKKTTPLFFYVNGHREERRSRGTSVLDARQHAGDARHAAEAETAGSANGRLSAAMKCGRVYEAKGVAQTKSRERSSDRLHSFMWEARPDLSVYQSCFVQKPKVSLKFLCPSNAKEGRRKIDLPLKRIKPSTFLEVVNRHTSTARAERETRPFVQSAKLAYCTASRNPMGGSGDSRPSRPSEKDLPPAARLEPGSFLPFSSYGAAQGP